MVRAALVAVFRSDPHATDSVSISGRSASGAAGRRPRLRRQSDTRPGGGDCPTTANAYEVDHDVPSRPDHVAGSSIDEKDTP